MDGVGVGRHAGLHAALAVIHRRHVEFVLVSVQVDVPVNQPEAAPLVLCGGHASGRPGMSPCYLPDNSGVGLDAEEAGIGAPAYKPERDSVSVLKKQFSMEVKIIFYLKLADSEDVIDSATNNWVICDIAQLTLQNQETPVNHYKKCVQSMV